MGSGRFGHNVARERMGNGPHPEADTGWDPLENVEEKSGDLTEDVGVELTEEDKVSSVKSLEDTYETLSSENDKSMLEAFVDLSNGASVEEMSEKYDVSQSRVKDWVSEFEDEVLVTDGEVTGLGRGMVRDAVSFSEFMETSEGSEYFLEYQMSQWGASEDEKSALKTSTDAEEFYDKSGTNAFEVLSDIHGALANGGLRVLASLSQKGSADAVSVASSTELYEFQTKSRMEDLNEVALVEENEDGTYEVNEYGESLMDMVEDQFHRQAVYEAAEEKAKKVFRKKGMENPEEYIKSV